MADTTVRLYDVPTQATVDERYVDLGDGSYARLTRMAAGLAKVAVTLTRPADTTAYAAKDALADSTSAPTVLTFANLARLAGGGGYIVKARALTNQAANVARLALHLYSEAPTAINDNAAYALLWANRAKRIGSLVFPAMASEGSGSDSAYAICTPGVGNLPLAFGCAAADRNVYGLLETLDAFTPASGQVFYVELTAEVY